MKKRLLGLLGAVCSLISVLNAEITVFDGDSESFNLILNGVSHNETPVNTTKLLLFGQEFHDTIEGEVMDEVDVHQLISLGNQVSLRKSGLNVSLITRSMIQQMAVQNVNELLSHVAGVDIRQRGVAGVQADIGIRGSSFDQVLILVDGVRMSDPQTGHHQLNLPIPLNAIEYIEVIKGGAAHKYGLNALSGVVNIVTSLGVHKDEKSSNLKKSIQSEVDLFGGIIAGRLKNTSGEYLDNDINYNQLGGRFFIQGQFGKLNFWVGTEAQKGNGYRINTEYQNIRNTVGLKYRSGKHTVNVLGGSVNNQFGASYFYAAPRDTFAQEEVNTQFIQGTYRYNLNKNGEFEMQLSSRWNYDHFVFREYNPRYYQNYHSSLVNMQRLQYAHKVNSKGKLGLGIDLRQESLTSTNLGDPNNNFKRRRDFNGAFLNYSQEFFNRLTFSGGIYALKSDALKTAIYPGFELNYQIVKGWHIYGNYGLGQRLPTFTDLYYKDPVNQSNPNLRPEFSESYELGLKIASGDFNWGMSVFQRNVFQMIDWLRPDIQSKWMPVNQSNLKFNGIEAIVNWRNALWLEGLDFSWSFCLLEGKLRMDSGMISKNALNYLGDHTTFKLNYRLTKQLTLGMYYRYFERFESPWSNNNSSNPGYGLLDLKVTYKVSNRFNIYMNGLNLLNTQYREISSVPMPPRWLQMGIVIKPGN